MCDWRKADPHRNLTFLLLIVGLVLAVIVLVMDYRKASLPLTAGLERNTYGGGSRTEKVTVETDKGEKSELEVEVKERIYTTEEVRQLFDRSIRKLDRLILGANDSLDYITSDMELLTKIPEEPVEIEWELSQYDVMNIYGELQEDALRDEGTQITLKAVLTYTEDRKMQAQYECTVRIYPPGKTKEEMQTSKIKEAIQKEQEKTKTEARLSLPSTVDGEKVVYYRKMDDRGMIGLGMIFLMSILFYALDREKEGKRVKEKEKQMLLDYPEVINKLTLFLGAGMTVKRAWKKVVSDYDAQKEIWGVRYVYEEMKITCHEMESGITEAESYERFGRRCRLQEYVKLGALLSQNLRRGAKGLSHLLKIEAVQAFEERKARAKRIGEEAGTKLLGPLFLMLAVVLFIVIVPAFMSMQM